MEHGVSDGDLQRDTIQWLPFVNSIKTKVTWGHNTITYIGSL